MKADDEDFSNFDPKLRWAKANNEEMSFPVIEFQIRERKRAILKLIEQKPFRSLEISHITGMPREAVIVNLKRMEMDGCVLEKNATSNGFGYFLKSKPKDYLV